MSKMQMFSVLVTEIDKENGSISQMTVESPHRTKEEAYEAMHAIYLEELKKRGLEDNSASDEEGNSVPGGYCSSDEAGIYEIADYALGQLLECFACVIQPIEVDIHPVNIGDHVFVVAPKLKTNTLGRTYRTHEHEVFKGEVWSVKYDSDDAVFVEVFAERTAASKVGTFTSVGLEVYRLGSEAFLDEESAQNALVKANKEMKEDTDDEETN